MVRLVPARELANIVVSELIQRTGVEAKEVQRVVYGQVIPSIEAPNIAREVVLGTGLPTEIDAYSVSRACTTNLRFI